MRGEIIQFSDIGGDGLISGDDGIRYRFTREDVTSRHRPTAGDKVDFVGTEGHATDIFRLSGDPRAGANAGRDLGVWGYFAKCMRLYFDGRGRARRKEYWSFLLFRGIFIFSLMMLFGIVVGVAATAQTTQPTDEDAASGAIYLLYYLCALPFLAPQLSVASRRFHDVGMSGWFTLLTLVPALGGLFMLVIALIPTQDGSNAYGRRP